MARQNHGPLSRAKGKLGGVVYQQYEGMQISREYQPNVKNPQTATQTENRAKFKLASQITALYKEVIELRLSKLSIYNRMRRAESVRAIYGVTDMSSDYVADADLSTVTSAINNKSMTEYAAPTIAEGTGAINVTAPAGAKIIGVIVGFDSEGKVNVRKVIEADATGSAQEFTLPSGSNSYKAMVAYSVALDEEGRSTFGNVTSDTTELVLNISRGINAGNIEVSDIASINVVGH